MSNSLRLLFLLIVCACSFVVSNGEGPLTFKNPLGPRDLGLGKHGGQTPHVYQHTDGFYYYVTTSSPDLDSIVVMRSRRLTEWDAAAESKRIVYNATANHQLFEPQVHHFNGNWYIYFSNEIGKDLNSSRNYVIASEGGANPMQAEYGPPIQLKAVKEADTTTSFHGTVLEYSKDELFFVWASDTKRATPSQFTTKTDTISLFIAPMSSPVQISGPAVLLRAPTNAWEKSILEMPQVLHSPTSDAVFITYFAGDFDDADSCLGLISIRHGFSPLVEENWSEGKCVFRKNEKQKVFSVGKAGFTKSRDGSESWILYTALDTVTPSAQKTRSVRAERFAWDKHGDPVFPRPAGLDIALRIPSEARVPIPAAIQAPGSGVRSGNPNPSPPGGLGAVRPANDRVRQIVVKLTSEIHAEACKKLGVSASDSSCTKEGGGVLTVISYKTQTVAGTNYFIKVRGHGGKIWHARIHEQSGTKTLTLFGLDGPKQESDDITYFEDQADSESDDSSESMPVSGGLGTVQPADDHVREVVRNLTSEIHVEACKKLGVSASDSSCSKEGGGVLTVLSYKTQQVAGTNYFIKVRGHGGKIWHARIYEQTGTENLELFGLDGPKQEKDDITYFEDQAASDDSSESGAVPVAGGLGSVQPADDHVREIVGKLTSEIHAEACKKLGVSASDSTCSKDGGGVLTVLSYKSQTVAGTNYFIKVRGQGGKIWHARIYEQTWTKTLQLSGLDGPKQEKDHIAYFE